MHMFVSDLCNTNSSSTCLNYRGSGHFLGAALYRLQGAGALTRFVLGARVVVNPSLSLLDTKSVLQHGHGVGGGVGGCRRKGFQL